MILTNYFKEELTEWLKRTKKPAIEQTGHALDEILADNDTMYALWAVYQKDIEEYCCDEEYAYMDAMKEIFGVDIHTEDII